MTTPSAEPYCPERTKPGVSLFDHLERLLSTVIPLPSMSFTGENCYDNFGRGGLTVGLPMFPDSLSLTVAYVGIIWTETLLLRVKLVLDIAASTNHRVG